MTGRSATTRRRRARLLGVILTAGLIAASCGESAPPPPVGVTVAEGFELTIVANGFDRPTQLAAVGDGRFVIGELAGAENDGTGRITVFDLDDPDDRRVIITGLDKPTGVAVRDDQLFVMESTRLRSFVLPDASTADASAPAASVVIADGLPNNGRSQGSLSISDDALLFNTSGRKRGAIRVDGSATLFSVDLDRGESADPRVFATGFKHAYAHTTTPDGNLFVVEMTDGTFDGERGLDELILIGPGDDAGWPFCVDDNRPVVEFGGTDARCADVPRSHALFDAGATPTAVIVAPWDPDLLLVTLWIRSEVVAVPVTTAGAPHAPVVVVEGIESPQSLLVDGDRALIVDHETGTIFALRPSADG